MATVMELINFYDNSSKEYQEFLQDLVCFNGDIPFDLEEVDKAQEIIISTVNSHLNQSQSHYNGLLLLDKILPQCSKDVLLRYCLLWMSKATQVLENIHSSPLELSICCKVLGTLIAQSKDIPEIHKQVSVQNVKQLVHAVNNLGPDRLSGPVYYLIAILLHQYPEVCERLQITIKKIILLQVDSSEKNLVVASAKCYALLAKATERSFKAPPLRSLYTGWTYNQALICNSLHVIMDELFTGLIEIVNVDVWDKLELPNISEKNVVQFYLNQKLRFLNLCTYLAHMLRGFGKKNSVFPRDILKVLCRGLAIQPSNLKDRSSVKEQMLYLILPKLHIALFDVMEALISGFKEQLVPFGSTILELFLQTLQWTETVLEHQITISGSKPFRNVRIFVYKCLNAWLMHTNALSGIETISDECLPSILKDIVPEKDRVLLTIQQKQNLSKRALKRLRDKEYEKSTYLTNGSGSNKEYSLDTDVCVAALNVLQNIFLNAGTLLKQSFYKTVQNAMISILYDCYLCSSEEKFYKGHSECRLQLLRALRALQMNPHSLLPLPTQYSLEIFEMALNDSNLQVTQEAKIALAEIEKIVHPPAPSIQLTQLEIIHKEFVSNQTVQESTETTGSGSLSNTVNIEDENVTLTSNKRLKVIDDVDESDKSVTKDSSEDATPLLSKRFKKTDASVDETDKSITKNSSEDEEIDENLLERSDSPIEKEIVIEKLNINIAENEKTSVTHDQLIKGVSSIPIVTDSSKTLLEEVKDKESINTEDMDITEESNQNLEMKEATTEVCTTGKEELSAEEEEEEEEMLHLFQDVPKASD